MFIKILLGWMASRLDGYKTYIAGIAFIAKGILGLIGNYWPDIGVSAEDPGKAVDEIITGWLIIAGKHAIVKVGLARK